MAPGSRRFVLRAAVFLLVANVLVHALQRVPPVLAQSPPSKTGAVAKSIGAVRYGTTGLPDPVIEMRDAILTAARSGRIEELRAAIELNEIKPVFSDKAIADPIAHLKAQSADGEGRDVLAAIAAILEAGWVALPLGRDLENNRVYLWPHFAETGVVGLSPEQETELLRLVSPAEVSVMRRTKHYTGWRLGIGADGVWHFLAKVAPLQ